MHAYVFTDAALEQHAGRFVWLSIDTEREENASFLERYPVEAWPSLYVIDPKSGEVALRWLGSATVPQLVRLLEDAERAVRGGAEGAEALLARADRLYGEGKKEEAATLYREILDRAPADWSRRPRVIEHLLTSLMTTRRAEECVRVARAELPKMAPSPSRLNASALGLSCALGLPKEHAERTAALRELEAHATAELEHALKGGGAAADDVSGIFDLLVSIRDDEGDAAGRKQIAERWAAYLEGEANKATTPEARTVFDAHRLLAYLAMGAPERALPMLERSEKELPQDYNPPYRIGIVFKELGRIDEALAANERALTKVYGPRKLRVLQSRAELFSLEGDPARARGTLEEALRVHDALPEGQRNPRARERIQKQLDGLTKPSGT